MALLVEERRRVSAAFESPRKLVEPRLRSVLYACFLYA